MAAGRKVAVFKNGDFSYEQKKEISKRWKTMENKNKKKVRELKKSTEHVLITMQEPTN